VALVVRPATAQSPGSPWTVDTLIDQIDDGLEVRASVLVAVHDGRLDGVRVGMYCEQPGKSLHGFLVSRRALDISFQNAIGSQTMTRVRWDRERPENVTWVRGGTRGGEGNFLMLFGGTSTFARRLQAFDTLKVDLPLLQGGASIAAFTLGDSVQSRTALEHVYRHCAKTLPKP
jgi:hypothetical protein